MPAVGLVFVANVLNMGADLGAMAATVQLLIPVAPIVFLLVVLSLGILTTLAMALAAIALAVLLFRS